MKNRSNEYEFDDGDAKDSGNPQLDAIWQALKANDFYPIRIDKGFAFLVRDHDTDDAVLAIYHTDRNPQGYYNHWTHRVRIKDLIQVVKDNFVVVARNYDGEAN